MSQNQNAQPVDNQAAELERAKQIAEKYDIETVAEVKNKNFLDIIIRWTAIAMSVYHIVASLLGTVPTLQHRGIHLAFVLFLGFMVYPMSKKYKGRHTAWDVILALVGCYCGAYIAINYKTIIFRSGMPIQVDQIMFVMCVILLFLAVRRSVGNALIVIPLVFLLYAYFGRYTFWIKRGVALLCSLSR